MGYVDIKSPVCIPVENNSYSICISHEITAVLYIMMLISHNMPIDYVGSDTSGSDVFALWY